MQPPFADLRYLIANAECGVNLADFYAGKVGGCDPSGRIMQLDYPPMSIWLGRLLQVRGSQTSLIAIVINLAFIGSILGLLRSRLGFSWRGRLLTSAIILGYPFQLAIERANLDVALFLILFLLSSLLSAHSAPSQRMLLQLAAASLLAFLAVSLKFYPIFAAGGLLLQRPWPLSTGAFRIGDLSATRLLVLLASILGLMLTFPLLLSVGNSFKEGGFQSHGLMALGYLNGPLVQGLGLELGRVAIKALCLAKVSALALGFILAWRTGLDRAIGQALARLPGESAWFQSHLNVVMGSTWLGCYIVTINYDYRLIFIIPFLGLLTMVTRDARSLPQARAWSAALIVTMIATFYVPFLQWDLLAVNPWLASLAEAISEFGFLPAFAGSLAWVLVANSWFSLPSPQRLGARV